MHPLPEYPRPSMRRDSYVNLNGPWDYAITQSSEFPAKWDGAILGRGYSGSGCILVPLFHKLVRFGFPFRRADERQRD